jgi:hypothetical protein
VRRTRGTCLRELLRFDEAEAALLAAHAFYAEHAVLDPQLGETIDELVLLYERWGRGDEERVWQARRDEWRRGVAR